MDELIALLGRNWRLLLVYPGGLTALGAVLLARLLFDQSFTLRRKAESWRGDEIVIASIWLLLIALLPLPRTGWPYALDLLIFLLLLELPYWLRILRSPDQEAAAIVGWAAPLLSVYPLLALSIAALGQGAGSLVVLEINRSAGLLHWAGIAGWACTLPPLLGLGPWQDHQERGTLLAIRRVAHLGLLLAAAVPANDQTPIAAALLGFGCIILPLGALHRWWRGDRAWWIAWQPWLIAIFTLLLAWTSVQTLLLRIR